MCATPSEGFGAEWIFVAQRGEQRRVGEVGSHRAEDAHGTIERGVAVAKVPLEQLAQRREVALGEPLQRLAAIEGQLRLASSIELMLAIRSCLPR